MAAVGRHLTSSMTGLLIAASPIVAVILERLTGGAERLGPLRWTGLAAGFAGVVVLAALAGLAVVCTALAFIVFFALIREAGRSR
ncbi:hypothetical protein [Planomonospora sp. ID82291]|uniref:hypothetical protein n=1 Tax=Planomonospora sp. ID82291 TaxID=2738136 RepID=UPI0018C412C9|nr:hypothetical protein [Planomonospora sp. ID82291]MBG0814883.1 hypothetical protein [Planomonospora sp. ID82291]